MKTGIIRERRKDSFLTREVPEYFTCENKIYEVLSSGRFLVIGLDRETNEKQKFQKCDIHWIESLELTKLYDFLLNREDYIKNYYHGEHQIVLYELDLYLDIIKRIIFSKQLKIKKDENE
jgi:hypothetical protein